MAKWEYQTILHTNDYDITPLLNIEGENGWELVSVVNMPSATTNAYFSNSYTKYIFKRLKEVGG